MFYRKYTLVAAGHVLCYATATTHKKECKFSDHVNQSYEYIE